MVKFLVRGAGKRNLIGIGLSEENVNLIKQGKPILLKLGELSPDLESYDVVVMWGRTQAEILHSIQEELGFEFSKETKMEVDKKTVQ